MLYSEKETKNSDFVLLFSYKHRNNFQWQVAMLRMVSIAGWSDRTWQPWSCRVAGEDLKPGCLQPSDSRSRWLSPRAAGLFLGQLDGAIAQWNAKPLSEQLLSSRKTPKLHLKICLPTKTFTSLHKWRRSMGPVVLFLLSLCLQTTNK